MNSAVSICFFDKHLTFKSHTHKNRPVCLKQQVQLN